MNLFELIKVGGQKLQDFVGDIWKKIADWFLKNKQLLISAYDKAVLEGWRLLAKYPITMTYTRKKSHFFQVFSGI